MQPPLGQVLVHNSDESIVMAPLDQMNEFVDSQVFKALNRFLYKFQI
jgi:hypothetical protein